MSKISKTLFKIFRGFFKILEVCCYCEYFFDNFGFLNVFQEFFFKQSTDKPHY